MTEQQVRVEQEASIVTRLERLQMQFDRNFCISGSEAFDKLHSYLQNLHTQVCFSVSMQIQFYLHNYVIHIRFCEQLVLIVYDS